MHDLRIESMRPFGCVATAARRGADLRRVPIAWLRALVAGNRVVVLRGFELFGADELVAYCRSWGPILAWSFGALLDLVEHPDPKNYIFTSGSVPLHWDGAFADAVPSLQVFQCLEAPPSGAGGETLFSDTTRVWEDASAETRATWEKVSITYLTERVAHYGGRFTAPLVGRHPSSGSATLRYAEPPDDRTAKLNQLELSVHGVPEGDVADLLGALRATLYDPRHCYAHAWREEDILIADNHALLHGRSAYVSGSRRHMQRVHIL
jgi:alpha-ketoglutarate-dependent taurine dioxygenase